MVNYTELKETFNGDIVEPNSPDYSASIARWAAQCARKARYVAFPKDEPSIVLALKFATSNSIPLAIKCGGHNPSGASSVENGLVIDLSRYFNTTRVDPVQKLVYVGGGATWETVDLATIKHGLATPGGTVNHTGVGGLTLAGGYGWLSGAHGLVIDNLVQATVVTANGAILTASESSHPDLFWAIRGGGSNFGIVTEFVLRLHPQRKTVFAGHAMFAAELVPKVAELVDEWHAQVGENEGMFFSLARGPPPVRMPVANLVLFYNGSEAEGRANFRKFFDLGPFSDTTREMPYEELNAINNPFMPHGPKYYMGGTSLRSKVAPQVQQVFDRMVSLSAAHPDPASNLPPFNIMVGYEYFPSGKITAIAPDATAFRSRGPQPNVVVVVTWDQEDDGTPGTPYARGFQRDITSLVRATEERPPREDENEGYGNYVCERSDMQAKIRVLWGDNYPRMQKIKKEYDPDLVFNRWFPIQPAE